MRFRALTMLLVLLTMMIAACGGENGDPTPTIATNPGQADATATSAMATSPAPEVTATPGPATPTATAEMGTPTADSGTPTAEVEIPDSPVGERLAWILEEMNEGGTGLTPEVIEDNFAPEFLSQIPPDQLSATIREFATVYGPFTLVGFWDPPTPTQVNVIVASRTDEEFLLSLAVQDEEPHLITGFSLQQVPAAAELESWDDLDEQIAALASNVSFIASDVTASEFQSVHALNADNRLAIGSTFKLYVLGELARQIEAGEASWDEEFAIREEWKSLPSGTMQDEPAGTTFTLREYAERMISISDNTATDHLMHRLGRENVQSMQAEMGHGEPERNEPFFMTREMFVLKLALPEERVEAFIAASPEEQREMLETEVAETEVSIDDAEGWNSPRYINEFEWFASVEDLRGAMTWLHDASQRSGLEPLQEILSINPGVPVDEASWTWVGFKAGSEPGVLNLTWLLERDDGRMFVLSASLNDEAQPIDQIAALELLMGAMNLLAVEE